MPASLIARDLTVTRGAFDVLAHVELTLSPGHRVGVIGPNGIGKSTLLQALGGRLTDTTTSVGGSVTRVPASATVGYLPQEADRRADETVDAFLARRTGVDRAQSALDAATTA
ncbi:MAG: ATP-binding cassette domain-containing protein, partial [Ilumatobacter sp.]